MSLISEQVRRLREFAKTLKYADEYNLVNGAADTIEELSAKLHNSQMERSSQYYNGGWIPVSERLPKDKCETYLACSDDGYIATIMYDENGRWLIDDCKIIAWMPLPEPYGGDADASNN